MDVVIFGASGNAGTSLIRAAATDPTITSITGVARRLPTTPLPKTRWVSADITKDDLGPLVRGADCVVHLAWLIQPSRDLATLHATNVTGSRRVFEAVVAEKVPSLVYASSVGAYSLGPKDHPVDESWPTQGVSTSFYSRHKAATERMLDALEAEHPQLRVVRLRPGLIFKRTSATEQRRLFAGPFVPSPLVRRELVPVIPDIARLRFQCVHSHDIGEAYRLAVTSDVRGPFNVAADPILDPPRLAELFGAKLVQMKPRALYALWSATYKLRLHPTPPGWLDLAFQTPVMDTTRARTVLGWEPRHSSEEALLELVRGMHGGAGSDTPPLVEDDLGMRVREVVSGVGRRNPY
ncbi:MAG: NAD-dependent epimerase/dehydratase family protein [Actinomycetota bacterium]|nr:NAD-dependent epimerase/dehydratase family protein [Actinomycetota bacterium]